jgi:hypothetical protein
MALRLKQIARAFQREDARFAARCTRALRALEGNGALPTELIPLGARYLARGALTARLLSVGRERPWPYALARQMDPADPGYLPRSLLPLHLNLSYRNWTTIGLPGWDREAVVDPGGWVTPIQDGPSVAVWIGDARRMYTLGPLPGWGTDDTLELRQSRLGDHPMVRTTARREDVVVEVDVFPAVVQGHVVFGVTARVRLEAPAPRPVRIGFAVRPANPEGAAPLFKLERRSDSWWLADDRPFLFVPHDGHEVYLSSWRDGDVYQRVGGVLRDQQGRPPQGARREVVECPVGHATGCEIYRVNLSPGDTFKRTVYAADTEDVGGALRQASATRLLAGSKADWEGATRAGARIELPVHQPLFQACRATLLALSDSNTVNPGPSTYNAFWYRDAAYHLAALGRLGFLRRAGDVLATYPGRQSRSGAWLSQDGQWDGTGQAIWTMVDHVRLSGDRRLLKDAWPSLLRAGRWIITAEEGDLMPTGWSAEHLGPADHYYWDALWACAGLREVSFAARMLGREAEAREFSLAHGRMLEGLRRKMGDGPVPAAPERRMDSAAVSALCGVWPLGVFSAREPAMRATVRWLLDHCMHGDGLFHDVTHSGVNPYLTCLLAQCRLESGDPDCVDHLDYLAAHASPTGCWPEAFLPGRGGVMGDGDHAWAAADFAMLCRNLVLREDHATLRLFQGADERWWDGETVVDGAPTRYGAVRLHAMDGEVTLDAEWREAPARVLLHKPDGTPGRLVVNGREVRGDGPTLELPG